VKPISTFWNRVKEARLARVLVVYLAGSWVVLQVTASVMLLLGATLLARTLIALQRVDLGVMRDGNVIAHGTPKATLSLSCGVGRTSLVAPRADRTGELRVEAVPAAPGAAVAAAGRTAAAVVPAARAAARPF